MASVKKKLPSPEAIWSTYCDTNSLYRTAAELEISRDKARKILVEAGYRLNQDKWTPHEDKTLLEHMDLPKGATFKDLAQSLKRTQYSIFARADKLGVTEPPEHRTKTNQIKVEQHKRSLELSESIPQVDHPVGVKKPARPSTPPRNPATRYYQKYKGGWAEVGGKRIYFRSKWEINYARYLEWLKFEGAITGWEFEPETFFFEGVRQGHTSYLPDFKVTYPDGTHAWHEVKGWMDAGSKTKLARMAKFYPDEKIYVVDSEVYKDIERQFSHCIPEWVVS